jgi:hypothetical protein
MRSKKAFARKKLSWAILSLVAIAITLIILWRMLEGGVDDIKSTACMYTVFQASETGDLNVLNCPPSNISISGSDEDKILDKISAEMRDCWFNMGKGDYFLKSSAETQGYHFCIICSLISYKSGDGFSLSRQALLEKLEEMRLPTGESFLSFISEENVAVYDDVVFSGGDRHFIYFALKEPEEDEISFTYEDRSVEKTRWLKRYRIKEETYYYKPEIGIISSKEDISCSFALGEQTLR